MFDLQGIWKVYYCFRDTVQAEAEAAEVKTTETKEVEKTEEKATESTESEVRFQVCVLQAVITNIIFYIW